MSVHSGLVTAIRAGLAELADPVKAPAMQAYMKSSMPYLGVTAVPARKLNRELIKAFPLASAVDWQDTIRELYDAAAYREERYSALAIARHSAYRSFRTPGSLTMFAHLIRTGAWWDLVDDASHPVGEILRRHRAAAEPVLRSWIITDDLWLRRSSIICQLGHRDETDVRLLIDAIEANVDDTDFFIRKAIGWALREYSKTDAAFVERFVSSHPGLSGLSRREALKWKNRPQAIV